MLFSNRRAKAQGADALASTLTWQPPRESMAAARQTAESRTAVLVCHGMGKQVQFETLALVADALNREIGERWSTRSTTNFRQVKSDNDWISCAELTMTDKNERQHRADLFEAYWAPLTEGKVTARDVTRFLLAAAVRGLRNSLGEGFNRWMFGRSQPFGYPASTLFGIIGALLLICAVWGAYALLITSAVGFLTQFYQSSSFASGGFSIASLSALWSSLNWKVALWAVLFLATRALHALYVQYVGDVAAYVSSHDVNKFREIRGAIQDAVCKTAKAVYQSRDAAGNFIYDHVIVVAHSLGSLVIYDAMNRLINEELAETKLTIPERTRLFLTFGSPLDKIAFIFRTQKKDAELREAFAASKQPMILNYAYRPQRWVNLYSPMDVISGTLDFYDLPKDERVALPSPKYIDNVRDPQAWIPLWAHQQYWKSSLLRRQLLDQIELASREVELRQ